MSVRTLRVAGFFLPDLFRLMPKLGVHKMTVDWEKQPLIGDVFLTIEGPGVPEGEDLLKINVNESYSEDGKQVSFTYQFSE